MFSDEIGHVHGGMAVDPCAFSNGRNKVLVQIPGECPESCWQNGEVTEETGPPPSTVPRAARRRGRTDGAIRSHPKVDGAQHTIPHDSEGRGGGTGLSWTRRPERLCSRAWWPSTGRWEQSDPSLGRAPTRWPFQGLEAWGQKSPHSAHCIPGAA